MPIYDISKTIEENMVVYKNKVEKRPRFEITRQHDIGGVRESKIDMDVHTGTHLDAPLHMAPEGESIESLDVARLICACRVLDFSHVTDAIGEDDLKPYKVQSGESILLKTRNSTEDFFNPDYVYLAVDGAQFLAKKKINLVGIDALGIERGQKGHLTHHALFSNNIIVLEGLDLSKVAAGAYQLVALPLKLKGLDGSPVRAVLIED